MLRQDMLDFMNDESWKPALEKPNHSGTFQVRRPNGAEPIAWWNEDWQRWELINENEREGYSTGEPCEVTHWRQMPGAPYRT